MPEVRSIGVDSAIGFLAGYACRGVVFRTRVVAVQYVIPTISTSLRITYQSQTQQTLGEMLVEEWRDDYRRAMRGVRGARLTRSDLGRAVQVFFCKFREGDFSVVVIRLSG
jgi:hypothetical protein